MKENQEIANVICWIRENKLIWDVLCGDNWFDCNVQDCIDMLETTVKTKMYPFALLLIDRLDRLPSLHEAGTNVMADCICFPEPHKNLLTEYICEVTKVAEGKGVMKEKL